MRVLPEQQPDGNITSDERLLEVADEFMTGHAAVLSASSFYDFLQPSHHGKKVFMCDGTACHDIRQERKGKTEPCWKSTAESEIGVMTCLGHCHSNDAVLVNGEIRLSEAMHCLVQ